MSAARHRGRARRPRAPPLPVQALYSVRQLAQVAGVPHRRLQRLLQMEGVRVLRAGRYLFVPLTELEEKISPLWESIKAAESLRGGTE